MQLFSLVSLFRKMLSFEECSAFLLHLCALHLWRALSSLLPKSQCVFKTQLRVTLFHSTILPGDPTPKVLKQTFMALLILTTKGPDLCICISHLSGGISICNFHRDLKLCPRYPLHIYLPAHQPHFLPDYGCECDHHPPMPYHQQSPFLNIQILNT